MQLDSDDSCFAATVEVIKLAPVKKNKETAQATHHTPKQMERMPSTTNVSHVDEINDNKQLSANRNEFQSVSDYRNELDHHP